MDTAQPTEVPVCLLEAIRKVEDTALLIILSAVHEYYTAQQVGEPAPANAKRFFHWVFGGGLRDYLNILDFQPPQEQVLWSDFCKLQNSVIEDCTDNFMQWVLDQLYALPLADRIHLMTHLWANHGTGADEDLAMILRALSAREYVKGIRRSGLSISGTDVDEALRQDRLEENGKKLRSWLFVKCGISSIFAKIFVAFRANEEAQEAA